MVFSFCSKISSFFVFGAYGCREGDCLVARVFISPGQSLFTRCAIEDTN